MGFLGVLASQLDSQFSIGENANNTLDAVVDGQNVKYGILGDFAQNIDKSAERRYVEEGYLRKDPYNTSPKQFEVLMQEPNATVLVKKRMFTSLAENFRTEFMDQDERLYFKAMKILFANKCRQISALEKLCKIQKATSILGQLDNQIIPLLITLTDTFTDGFGQGTDFWGALGSDNPFKNTDMSNFVQTINKLRTLYAFNQPSPYTTWITDSTNFLESQFGQGTGVIEITNFTNINTNTTLSFAQGNCNFSITDPYESMLITEYDIERAIADATNAFYNKRIFQLGKEESETLIAELQNKLNQYRIERKASPITFRINPDTLLSKRVVAIIDRIGTEILFNYDSTSAASIFSGGAFGGGVTVAPEYLQGGAVAGYDGLSTQKAKTFGGDSNVKKAVSESELSVFQRLISTIYSKLSLMANSVNAFQTSNKNTNYARRNLRFNFLGKLIIQPMDTVRIYMSSKSRYDNKLLSGLNNMFNGAGFLQNLNNTASDLTTSWDSLFNPKQNINLQVEKCAYVGSSFPNFLWSIIRNQFISEKEGAHVFAGLVEQSTDSWQDGKFTVNVQCKDQATYLDKGRVNFNPGVDVYNGSVFDPITPFKNRFDTITSTAKAESPELLDENKWLLSVDGQSALVKHKSGPTVGSPVTQDSLIQDQKFENTSGLLTKTFYAPDGLVYKWKEGIGVMVQFGDSRDINGPDRTGYPSISKEPFAGQDVMNVLSLLITGTPYNYATYWNAMVNSGGVGRDPMTGQDSAHTFLGALRTSLAKNNALWGNFIPFKSLSVDEQTYAKQAQGSIDLATNNNDLNNKLSLLKDIQAKLAIFQSPEQSSNPSLTDNDAAKQKLMVQASLLRDNIETLIKKNEDMQKSYAINIIGDSISFDGSDFITESNQNNKNLTSPQARRLIRRRINELTKRMSYNVRGNDDKNFLIIDDFYDKDYDIAAFNKDLTDGMKLYNNEFGKVSQNIVSVANLLNLEVFCDSQGHIRIRPPQYNRMPSSVFYKMMYLKQSLGVQIFPQFMEDLFNDTITTLRERVEVLDDQIRLYCAALGYNTDIAAKQFISDQKNYTIVGNGQVFDFISDENSGIIENFDAIKKLANPDVNTQDFNFSQLSSFGNIIFQAESTRNTFNTAYRSRIILEAVTKQQLSGSGYSIDNISSFEENARVDELITRIQTKSGKYISKDYFKVAGGGQTLTVSGWVTKDELDVFKITKEIADFVASRQQAIKLLYSNLKNLGEYKSLDNNPDNTTNALFMPGNFSNSQIPEVFEHMIEDESYDDLGVGSGSRFVIKRSQIKSMNFMEMHPDYTAVEVHGVLNEYSSNSLPPDFNSFPQGGNAIVTARATDYSMWRNYGFFDTAPVKVPFLRNPELQCAPYATMLLSRARKEILRGTVTIAGNEYMQPGEVVFIEDRGLLFYVTSVRHSMTMGSGFTTTLDLTYGHAPGEYIPTMLDVVGKMIINNRDLGSVVIERQSSAANESNIGIIQRDKSNPSVINTGEDQYKNTYSNFNESVIKNALYTVRQFMNNITKDTNTSAQVELRIYYDSNNPVDEDLRSFANSTMGIFLGGIDAGPSQTSNSSSAKSNIYLSESEISVVEVDLSIDEDPRSPSQKAISAVRLRMNDMIASSATSSSSSNQQKKEKDKLRKTLFSYIVDCWIVTSKIEVQIGS